MWAMELRSSAEALKTVVSLLAEPPFNNETYKARDLDDLAPRERLQLLRNCISSLGGHSSPACDSASKEEAVEEIVEFAHLHSCPLVAGGSDDKDPAGLSDRLYGDSVPAFLDLLHWILSNASTLTTRVYLSAYLSPLRPPPDFENDARHSELLETLAECQAEFREAHSSHEEAKAGEDTPLATVKGDIKSMEAEANQLSERLAKQKSNLAGNLLLAASRKMREAQEEEAALEDRLLEEDHRRRSVDGQMKRVAQTFQLLDSMSEDADASTWTVLHELEAECRNHHADAESRHAKIDRAALANLDASKERPRWTTTRWCPEMHQMQQVISSIEVAAGLEFEISKKKSDLEQTGVGVSGSISCLQRTAEDALASLKSAKADVDRMRARAEYFRS